MRDEGGALSSSEAEIADGEGGASAAIDCVPSMAGSILIGS